MICDLAETYGILDYRSVPARLLGTLLVGLREDSRLMQAYAGTRGSLEQIMLASLIDSMNLLLWSRTEDGRKGRNKPTRIAPYYLGKEQKKQKRTDIETYSSLDEFYRARQAAIERIEKQDART